MSNNSDDVFSSEFQKMMEKNMKLPDNESSSMLQSFEEEYRKKIKETQQIKIEIDSKEKTIEKSPHNLLELNKGLILTVQNFDEKNKLKKRRDDWIGEQMRNKINSKESVMNPFINYDLKKPKIREDFKEEVKKLDSSVFGFGCSVNYHTIHIYTQNKDSKLFKYYEKEIKEKMIGIRTGEKTEDFLL